VREEKKGEKEGEVINIDRKLRKSGPYAAYLLKGGGKEYRRKAPRRYLK